MSSIRLFTDGQLDTAREAAVLPYLSHIPNLEEKIRHIARNKEIDYCVTCGRPGTDHIFIDSTDNSSWFVSTEDAHQFYSLTCILLFGFR